MEVVLASVARLLYCGCSPVASRVPEVSGYQLRESDQSERSESLTRRSKSKDGGFKPLFFLQHSDKVYWEDGLAA